MPSVFPTTNHGNSRPGPPARHTGSPDREVWQAKDREVWEWIKKGGEPRQGRHSPTALKFGYHGLIMIDHRLATIASDLRRFVHAACPEMVVRVEYWSHDPARIALFFIDERFRDLYPGQRYHYLLHLIPEDYYRAHLADSVWFELAPGEDPESIEYPDQELISAIKPGVLTTLKACGFFTALDELLYPKDASPDVRECSGDFRHSKHVLGKCGIAPPDWSDVFHVLMDEGAFCDCEVLYNVAPESLLRAKHWRSSHAAT
jgi:hypothetical protein